MQTSDPAPGRLAPRVLFCVVLVVVAGCSVGDYEERLNRTNDLYGYMNTQNENLQSEWGDTYGFGIRMRPPKPFVLIPPPAPPAEETEEAEEIQVIVDERHPTFLPGITELPGLIGAWQAQLPADDGRDVFAFLYVMGNHQRFLDMLTGEGGGPEPSELLNDLEATLQFSILGHNTPLPERNTGDQDNEWYREMIPKSPRVEGYPIPKDFRAISLLPSEERRQQIADLPPIRLQLYEYAPQGSNVQLAVLMVYPVSVQGDPRVRLRMALETLEMNEEPPRPQRSGDGAGAEQPSGF